MATRVPERHGGGRFRSALPDHLGEARGQALGQSNARLQQASSAAVTTLLKLMVSPEAPPTTRVRAAQTVVELAHKSFELDNLELRLAHLEETAGQDSNQPHSSGKR